MAAISEQIEALKTANVNELTEHFKRLFGQSTTPRNRSFLIRQLTYKIQELELGGVSLDVKDRIQKLIEFYDPINKIAIKTDSKNAGQSHDARLPMPGSFITKTYKGKRLQVKVLESGFEYESVHYQNLSAVAKAITGSHWNGFLFFGVKRNGRK
jgi:hypothetical protein